jgi:hypothetical protein
VSSACLALRYRSLIDTSSSAALATALTLVARQMWRYGCARAGLGHRLGLVVGHAPPVAGLVTRLKRTGEPEMRVVAACSPTPTPRPPTSSRR